MARGWRIVSLKYAATAFSGEGARLYGGRWNSPGQAAVYLADSRALAALEVLVHLSRPFQELEYVLFGVEIPDRMIRTLRDEKGGQDWIPSPSLPAQTQALGDAFLEQRSSAVLRVPSQVIAGEFNYLVNPKHPLIGGLKVGQGVAFYFDNRLLRKDSH